jgi:hypothetical protein
MFHSMQKIQVVADNDTEQSNLIGQSGRVIDPEYLAEYGEEETCNLVRLNGSNRVLCFVDEELEAR